MEFLVGCVCQKSVGRGMTANLEAGVGERTKLLARQMTGRVDEARGHIKGRGESMRLQHRRCDRPVGLASIVERHHDRALPGMFERVSHGDASETGELDGPHLRPEDVTGYAVSSVSGSLDAERAAGLLQLAVHQVNGATHQKSRRTWPLRESGTETPRSSA